MSSHHSVRHDLHHTLGSRPFFTADHLLLARYGYLQRLLTEATDELDAALLAGDADTAAKAGRRLASIGWLLREAADKRDRSNG